MLKKILIFSLVVAAGLSPFLPKVFADNASWKTLLADRVWDHSTFRVDRLTFDSGTSNPMKRNGVAFVSRSSTQCTDPGTCNKIDLSILKNGKSQTVNGVDQQFLNPSFAMAQKEKFVYFTKSTDPNVWVDVSFVDPNTGETHPLTSLARRQNEMSMISFSTSGDRMFTSVMQMDKKTKQIQSSIVATSDDGKYDERNIAFQLNAPWQQVVDGYNDKLLVKFQFSGGNKQLWLIDSKTKVMSAIPNTWTEPNADILFAHFLSDGTVVFFQNYIAYTYNPGLDKEPQSHGNAKLSWDLDPNQNVQMRGGVMAWTSAEHILYTSTLDGITELSAIKEGTVYLDKDALYFADAKGTWKYSFVTKQTTKTPFLVTDVRDDVMIGTDTKGNVWYQNSTNNDLFKIGYGTNPVSTDATHVIWKGTDGAIYQASLAPILSMAKSNKTFEGYAVGTRLKATGDSHVYIVGNDGQLHWIVSETVAHTIFGSNWNKGIVEVTPTFLWRYANGTNVSSEQNVKSL